MDKTNRPNKDLRCVIIAFLASIVGALATHFVFKLFGG